jgi:hypothetical protein
MVSELRKRAVADDPGDAVGQDWAVLMAASGRLW